MPLSASVKKPSVPASKSTDAHGTTFVIPGEPKVVTRAGQLRRGCPAVEVWWSRNDPADETLIVRQHYEDRSTADVHEYTFGQVYDLIDALNQAVESK